MNNNFTESRVRMIAIASTVLFLILAIKNFYFIFLALAALLVYFSTKSVIFFKDDESINVRVFFWALCFVIFYLITKSTGDFLSQKGTYTLIFITICIGVWVGDIVAKYVWLRLKILLAKHFKKGEVKKVKIMKIDIETKKYLKRPGKKFGINYYYITLLMDGQPQRFFLDGDYYEKLKNKHEIEILLKKGFFNDYIGIDIEKSNKEVKYEK